MCQRSVFNKSKRNDVIYVAETNCAVRISQLKLIIHYFVGRVVYCYTTNPKHACYLSSQIYAL